MWAIQANARLLEYSSLHKLISRLLVLSTEMQGREAVLFSEVKLY